MNTPKRDYETLDALVVLGTLIIIGCSLAALIYVKIPSEQLPIVASLLGTLVGTIIGGYAGFRWGSNLANKQAAESAAKTAETATGALASIAGSSATTLEEIKP